MWTHTHVAYSSHGKRPKKRGLIVFFFWGGDGLGDNYSEDLGK